MSLSPLPLSLSRRPPAVRPGPLDDATRARRARWPVALVSMPFMEHDRPSIQLGLLKAIATGHGFPVRTLHANLDLAVRLGIDKYTLLCAQRGRMVGDWLFSLEAFADAAPDPDARLLDDFADDLDYFHDSREAVREHLLKTRHEDVPAYLDGIERGFPWESVRVVGFTSTFQQSAASFALARRLKRRFPELLMVFGGANFDGEMGLELVRTVDCVDYAVIGEADSAFPALLAALADGEDPGAVPGVARRADGAVHATPAAPPLQDLDELPAPDYTEYFERAEAVGLLPRSGHRNVWIPFESARGCWWGAKHHCTFCGLNGTTMAFRSKSADRVLTELADQARAYHSFMFEAVDNILDMQYLKKMLPAIVESEADYELFYEVKANLGRAQLKLLAQAGVTRIQPGLESLSSNVLRLMNKGVRAAQNVNLLRWAQYYGIGVAWNVLWGFPGETKEDYAEQAAVMPYLVHLRPPGSATRIWMERFSPLFTRPDDFRMRSRTAEPSYRYVYPRAVDHERIAYFFEYQLEDALPESAYDGLVEAVTAWNKAWEAEERPVLTYWSAPEFLQIYDTRRPDAPGTYSFTGELAEIYLATSDRPTTAHAVREKLGSRRSEAEIREVFSEFGARGLMFLDGDLAVALALPAVPGR